MKIVFFISSEVSPYAGAIRPFLNWAKMLSGDHKVSFILLECDGTIQKYINKNIKKTTVYDCKSTNQAKEILEKNTPDYIFGDDWYPRMKILKEITNSLSIQTVIYCQILFGLRSVSRLKIAETTSMTEKILYFFLHYFPFIPLTHFYQKLLKKSDIIIANSQITANLLYILYGIQVHTILYPPIDFTAFTQRKVKKEKSLLLYLGSYSGDTNEKLTKNIAKQITSLGYTLYLLGNSSLQIKLHKLFPSTRRLENISNRQLSIIYQKCFATIAPQEFELCGYVPLESIACGTPVVAYGYLGPSETISNMQTGFLCYRYSDFLKGIDITIKLNDNAIQKACKKKINQLYSNTITDLFKKL